MTGQTEGNRTTLMSMGRTSLIEHSNLNLLPKRASACGKAIIVGEHAVVYGVEAVATPVHNLRLNLEIEPTPHAQGISMQLGGQKASNHLTQIVNDAFDVLGHQAFSLNIKGSSKLLMGAGMGSSAALCVATLRGLSACLHIELNQQKLSELGNRMEKRFHGNPSGLDAAVVAYERIISFQRGSGVSILSPTPIRMDQILFPWRFAIIDSDVRSSTISMVKKAEPYFKHMILGDRRLYQFEAITQDVKKGFEEGHAHLVAEAMDQASRGLDEAGVVTEQLRQMMSLCKKMGALAAKPTGAGGGGCIIVLLNPKHATHQLLQFQNHFGSSKVFEVTLT